MASTRESDASPRPAIERGWTGLDDALGRERADGDGHEVERQTRVPGEPTQRRDPVRPE